MNAPRVAYCLFCDDIRQEVGGKTSLIGIYHGDITFNAPKPVAYPKLCAHLTIISEPADYPEFIEVSMYGPGEKEIVKFRATSESAPDAPEGAQKSIVNIAFQSPPITFSEEGFIEVWVETEREKMRAGRLLVSFAAPDKAKIKKPMRKKAKKKIKP